MLAAAFALNALLIIEQLRSTTMDLDPSMIKQRQVVAHQAMQDVNLRVALTDDQTVSGDPLRLEAQISEHPATCSPIFEAELCR